MRRSPVFVFLFCFLFSIPLLGQGRMNQPGFGMAQRDRNYQSSTAQTIKGEVTRVENLAVDTAYRFLGVHIALKDTTGEERIAHLGPDWFLKEKGLELKVGDRLEVYASNVLLNGTSVWIAAEVKRGNMVWFLRDRNTGVPYWAAWGSKLAGRNQGGISF